MTHTHTHRAGTGRAQAEAGLGHAFGWGVACGPTAVISLPITSLDDPLASEAAQARGGREGSRREGAWWTRIRMVGSSVYRRCTGPCHAGHSDTNLPQPVAYFKDITEWDLSLRAALLVDLQQRAYLLHFALKLLMSDGWHSGWGRMRVSERLHFALQMLLSHRSAKDKV